MRPLLLEAMILQLSRSPGHSPNLPSPKEGHGAGALSWDTRAPLSHGPHPLMAAESSGTLWNPASLSTSPKSPLSKMVSYKVGIKD